MEPVPLPVVRTLSPGIAALGLVPTALPQVPSLPLGPKSLQAIRAEFHEIAGGGAGRTIGAEDIARHWESLLLRENDDDLRMIGPQRSGKQQKQAIALRVSQLMLDMDLKRTGQVGLEEWVHYMLLARSGFAARQVNVLLDKALERNRSILVDLQRMFDAADSTKSGSLSFSEIVSMYSRKVWHLRPSTSGPSKHLTEEELKTGDPEEFARAALQAMDINGDEKISYPEFMAYSLGRRKHEVLLHMYDLSNGAAKSMSHWVLGTNIDGVWHTGVVVYGKEYYYSKDTVFADAGDTSFGKPTRIIHLGHTLWRQDELHEFVTAELKPVFQRDTYDVVCNNCNHFSDRVCMFLVGKHPPAEVLNQPSMLLRARAVRVIRPMLNWWLRDRIVVREKGVALPQGQQRLKPGEQPPLGSIVTVHAAHSGGSPVLGQVTSMPDFARDSENESSCSTGAGTATMGGNAHTAGMGAGSCIPLEQGCGGLWSGTCGVIHGTGASGGIAPEGVWVQYFDISLGTISSTRAQVRTEYVPHSRLSIGGLYKHDGEAIFRKALKSIASQTSSTTTSRTGRGAVPYRVPMPTSMAAESSAEASRLPPGVNVVGDEPWQVVSQL